MKKCDTETLEELTFLITTYLTEAFIHKKSLTKMIC